MDDVCPITATRCSVKDLNLTVTKPWRPWYTPANEVMHVNTAPKVKMQCNGIYMCWIMMVCIHRLEATFSNTSEDSYLPLWGKLVTRYQLSGLRDRRFSSTPLWKACFHLPFHCGIRESEKLLQVDLQPRRIPDLLDIRIIRSLDTE